MSGSAIQNVGSFIDQELNTTSSPTFASITLVSGASDGYVYTSDEFGHGSWEEAPVLSGSGGIIPIGLIQGLVVSRKDDDEVFISGGSIEINGAVYVSNTQLTIAFDSEVTGWSNDLCVSGTATASSSEGGYGPENAVDDNSYSSWYTSTPTDSWWQYQFDTVRRIQKFVIHNDNNTNYMTSFKLKLSNTGAFTGEEVELLTASGLGQDGEYTYTFENAVSALYYRVYPITWETGVFIENIQMMAASYDLQSETSYYVYADPPVSDNNLNTENFIITGTAPTFDDNKGGYYHTTNTDQRALAYFTTDEYGYIPIKIVSYTEHNHDDLYYTKTEVNTISGTLHDEISNITSGIANVVDDTSPQLGGDLDTNGKNIILDSTPATDHLASGFVASMVCGETTVFGNVGYVKSDGKMWLSSANSSTTMPVTAIALESGNADDNKQWLFQGFIRDESWDWTVGGSIYAGTSAGSLTQTSVSGTGEQAQVVGVALTQDTMLFNPSYVLVEVA